MEQLDSSRFHTTEVLVVGGGIAGLRAALSAREAGQDVLLVRKGTGASPSIMGFNVPVGRNDSEEVFYSDILNSGVNMNDVKLAHILAYEARVALADLQGRGLRLSKCEMGYDLLRPLGSTYPRLVHYKGITGSKIAKLLRTELKRHGVNFISDISITDLLVDQTGVIGACGIDLRTGEFIGFRARAVILSTGGCGQLYLKSTYPRDIVCAGYGIGFRAGAEFIDMEFIQFEPCCFAFPKEIEGEPIPTTMLMAGGRLLNDNEEDVLTKHGLRADKHLQKDILSLAISKEIEDGMGTVNKAVYFDISMLPYKMVAVDHSIFYKPALKAGIDLTREPAEVAPVAHTSLGGLRISEKCETSVRGLYAAGEIVGGVHGANRIGGNSGTEVLVFGNRAGKYAASHQECNCSQKGFLRKFQEKYEAFRRRKRKTAELRDCEEVKDAVQKLMQDKVGVRRNEAGLKAALEELRLLEEEVDRLGSEEKKVLIEIYDTENMVATARLIVHSALERKESRGVHYRTDFPEVAESWQKSIMLRDEGGRIHLSLTV